MKIIVLFLLPMLADADFCIIRKLLNFTIGETFLRECSRFLLPPGLNKTLIDGTIIETVEQDVNNVGGSDCVNDMSLMNFYYWKKSLLEPNEEFEIRYGDESQIHPVNTSSGTILCLVLFHDIGGNGKEDWILNTTNSLMEPIKIFFSAAVIISVNYSEFVLTKEDSVLNAEMIANRSAEVLDWVFRKVTTSETYVQNRFVGHGMGALIASRTAQLVIKFNNIWKPSFVLALDPENIGAEYLNLTSPCNPNPHIPEIQETDADYVHALHTSTCSRSPQISVCDNTTNTTIGSIDFYANGGSDQPGCSSADLSCKRKRAIELFNDALIIGRDGDEHLQMFAWLCGNYETFKEGKCFLMDYNNIRDFSLWSSSNRGRYYFYTNPRSPFGRGYSQTPA